LVHPQSFAERYLAAWNDHDVERILSFYDVKAEFRSPFAKLFVHAGLLQGTAAIREFFNETLRRRPGIRIELLEVFSGHDAVCIYARDESNRVTVFTAVLNAADKIALGILCYNKGR